MHPATSTKVSRITIEFTYFIVVSFLREANGLSNG
jgi:hypothetical protein